MYWNSLGRDIINRFFEKVELIFRKIICDTFPEKTEKLCGFQEELDTRPGILQQIFQCTQDCSIFLHSSSTYLSKRTIQKQILSKHCKPSTGRARKSNRQKGFNQPWWTNAESSSYSREQQLIRRYRPIAITHHPSSILRCPSVLATL